MFESASFALNAALFAVAAAAVWRAGAQLTRAADGIAARTGAGQEILGLLLLGGVTSLPELAVAATATLQGTPELTVNDLLGSAAINVLLLALADARLRGRALTTVQGSPKVLLVGVLVVMMMAVVVAPSITGDALLWGMGRWTWLMLLLYAGAVWMMSHSHAESAWQPKGESTGERATGAGGGGDSLRKLVLRSAVAAVVILVAGFVLARTGQALAEQSGLGTSFFGVLVLAFATSLPEASTVFTAVRLGRYAMAISDVFGTNLFNVTIIALVDALHPGGPVLVEAGRFASFAALMALVLTALFLGGMVERRNRTLGSLGYDSVLALVVYAGGLAVLYQLR